MKDETVKQFEQFDEEVKAANEYADRRYLPGGHSSVVAREAFLAGVSWGKRRGIESEVIG